MSLHRLLQLVACAGAAAILSAPVPSGAQDQAAVDTATEEVRDEDALTCWWRTTAGAVRVGEVFSLVLTCAVLETDEVQVVPEESRLDPTAIQFPPFDVVGGSRASDILEPPHRFLQYRYNLRLITDDRFGLDARVPEMAIAYRVRSRSTDGALSEGRDQTYQLPALPVRILSTVPDEATDIRDGGGDRFEVIDSRMFAGSVLRVAGVLSLALAAFAALAAVLAGIGRLRARKPARERRVPGWLVRLGVSRELAGIQRERAVTAWTPELVDRALSAARIVAAGLVSAPIAVLPAAAGAASGRGRVVVPASWRGRRRA
ncbi:MAG: hypothetical protein FJW23_08370, partial [Acidimicrobiia bacterium]|nr:hypothetical protein [Acidimicrobiia bacterium]